MEAARTLPKLSNLVQLARKKSAAWAGRAIFLFATATLLLAVFLWEPIWFGHKMQPSTESPTVACGDPKDRHSSAAFRLRAAWEAERDGEVGAAERAYSALADSTTACVRGPAGLAMDRLGRARERLGPAYPALADWAHISSELRTPLLGIYLLLVLYLLLFYLPPREGIRIEKFSVYGSSHAAVSDVFGRSLLSFTNSIRRAYDSEYLRRAGVTVLFEDLSGPTIEGASALEKALAEAGESEVKTVVSFALKAFNLMRRAAERPRFKLEGSVYFFPGSARVVSTLKDLTKKEKDEYLEATLSEFLEMPLSSFVQEILIHPAKTAPASTRYVKAQDLREVTEQLHALALVLASKIRFKQSQAKEMEYKPGNWASVCLFTAAASQLDR